jgi:peptide/nickel transport system ATP-binding protein
MDRGEARVLNDISIDVERNEILGVVGESGSGKSMFASSLLDAVVDPGQLQGNITYHPDPDTSVDILSLSKKELKRLRWNEISMAFQGAMSSFNPTISIRKHFLETIEAHGEDREVGIDRAREIFRDLYLDPERVLDSYPHELSGGMKQRALIALSLVLEPKVLVMDEPTSALDLLMQQSILQLLREIKQKYNLTLIFITHDLPLVASLADRMAVMYAFEFVEIGPTSEIISDAAHPYTRSLLKATPNLNAPVEEMEPIAGAAPDPVNVPSGCSYHRRCPLADEQCRTLNPEYHDTGANHRAACFHWEEAREEMPIGTTTHDSLGGSSQSTLTDAGTTDDVVVSLFDVEVHFEQYDSLIRFMSEPDIVKAVDGVSIDIHENEVMALVGESGCGKTTLGKVAIGLQRPTGGTVEYRGQDVFAAKDGQGAVSIPYSDIRKVLQIVHQDPGSSLNPYRKILHTLSEPLKKWFPELNEPDRVARIRGMLETVGMTPPEDYAERYPHQLSGGEKQRVALIQSLMMNPDLILADEAVSALDVSLRIEIMDLMLELQDYFDTSYLFISHDLSNARYITEKAGGKIGIMYLGKLVEIGTPKEILNNPQHPYTKALLWASPDLVGDEERTEMPMRDIDIPDPVDPPTGCRFHTRCPKAREVCTDVEPNLRRPDGDGQQTACFRTVDEHEYWDSPSIVTE